MYLLNYLQIKLPEYNECVSKFIKVLPDFPKESDGELYDLQCTNLYFRHIDQVYCTIPEYQKFRLKATNAIYGNDNPLGEIYIYYISIIACITLDYTSQLSYYIDMFLKEGGSMDWLRSINNLPPKAKTLVNFLVKFVVSPCDIKFTEWNRIIYAERNWTVCEFIHIVLITSNIVAEEILSTGSGVNPEIKEKTHLEIFIEPLSVEIKSIIKSYSTNYNMAFFNNNSNIEFSWEAEGYSFLQSYCSETASILDEINLYMFNNLPNEHFNKDKITAIFYMINRYFGNTYDRYTYTEINKILDINDKQFVYSLLPVTPKKFDNSTYDMIFNHVNSVDNVILLTILTAETVREALIINSISSITLCKDAVSESV